LDGCKFQDSGYSQNIGEQPDAVEFATHASTQACGVSIGKPDSGDFDAQIMLQRHFYTAGLAA
jgi:hypothetical protein